MVGATTPGAVLMVSFAGVKAHTGVLLATLEAVVLGDIFALDGAVVAEGGDVQGLCHHLECDLHPALGEMYSVGG